MNAVPTDLMVRAPHLSERASADHLSFNCPPEGLLQTVRTLKDEFGFDMLMDVTAVDWESESPRFSAVYHLFSSQSKNYLRLMVACLEDMEGNPSVPSLVDLYPGANWHERETYDMFGIHFESHPDLRRILMWDEYPYFPLRKEFPLAGLEVEFPAADVKEATNVRVQAAPMMGGPFVAAQGAPMSKSEPRAKDESWTERREKPLEN
ncbi:MAG: NADH-quinone oxidoreductase subunit C [Puniceicoccaceae bacterium]